MTERISLSYLIMNFYYDPDDLYEYYMDAQIPSGFEKEWIFCSDSEELHIKPIEIEFSTNFPESYALIKNKVSNEEEKFEVDGRLSYLKISEQKIIVYLPVIFDPSVFTDIPKEVLLKFIIHFQIGQWICFNLNSNDQTFTKESFYNTGSIFRNFIGNMITYKLLKSYIDPNLYFDLFLYKMSGDDFMFHITFLENYTYKLKGLELSDIIGFAKTILELKKEDVTKDFSAGENHCHLPVKPTAI